MKSTAVHSSQPGCHQQLEKTVLRHQRSSWQQPLRAHTRQVFTEFLQLLKNYSYDGIILDCGCGTGASTILLAEQNRKHLVVGIDQSFARLGRGVIQPEQEQKQLITAIAGLGNGLLLRAELADFWRLLVRLPAGSRLPLQAIYLYYPNPWPKPGHLQRRWHGHPVFPELLDLQTQIIVRSNWKIYIEEFALALETISGQRPMITELIAAQCLQWPVSPFEKKYAASEHSLWQLHYQP